MDDPNMHAYGDHYQDTSADILRDVCELEPANPDLPDTVCVSVEDLKLIIDRHIEARAAVEAALRDAPQQAEPPANTTFKRDEWGALSPEAQKTMRDAVRERTLKAAQGAQSIRDVSLGSTPSAPTAAEPTAEEASVVEPRDERAMAHELIKVAAWLLSPEPTRQIDRLEDQTHIGHRQFESAQEAMRETLRNKAFEIRKFVDALASKGTK